MSLFQIKCKKWQFLRTIFEINWILANKMTSCQMWAIKIDHELIIIVFSGKASKISNFDVSYAHIHMFHYTGCCGDLEMKMTYFSIQNGLLSLEKWQFMKNVPSYIKRHWYINKNFNKNMNFYPWPPVDLGILAFRASKIATKQTILYINQNLRFKTLKWCTYHHMFGVK